MFIFPVFFIYFLIVFNQIIPFFQAQRPSRSENSAWMAIQMQQVSAHSELIEHKVHLACPGYSPTAPTGLFTNLIFFDISETMHESS